MTTRNSPHQHHPRQAQPRPIERQLAASWRQRELVLPVLPMLVGAAGAALLAGLLIVLSPARLPAGALLEAEARLGLLARAAAGHPGTLFQSPAAGSPLMAALVALVGRPLGFGPAALHDAALLAALGTVLFTGLWLRRALGPGWALAGALLVAGSTAFLHFGGLALSPIAGALGLAATLWLLAEAERRAESQARGWGWYAGAGLAAATAFLADPTLRILPLLLLVATALRCTDAAASRAASLRWGLLLALAVADATLTPVLPALARGGLLGFWVPTPGLGGTTVPGIVPGLRGYAAALELLVWPPSRALLGPLCLPWLLAGVFALGRRRAALSAPLLLALTAPLLLLPAALVRPVDPGRLLPALPLLVALPLAGMRLALTRVTSTRLRALVALLIVATLLGSTLWGVAARSGETAGDAGTDQALALARQLSAGQEILLSSRGLDDTLRYLWPAGDGSTPGPLAFDGGQLLALPLDPANGDGVIPGYLLAPAATPLDPALAPLVDPMRVPELSGGDVTVYRIDARARDALPASVPTVPYDDGAVFLGHQLQLRPPVELVDGQLSLVLTYGLPGDGRGRTLRVRLHPANGGPDEVVSAPLPAFTTPTDVARLVLLDAPASGSSADLYVALLGPDGQPVTGPGLTTDGELFLNRYSFSQP